jgi:hypothetical protein
MFHQLFQHPPTIERHQTAPLLEERCSYLAHCADQGRTRSSLRLIAQHLAVPVKYEAEYTTNETHRWVALDGP